MSCRETKGNSAITSLGGFLTGAKERQVQEEFHAAKREALDHARRAYTQAQADLAAGTELPADRRAALEAVTPFGAAPTLQEVREFLGEARALARHDTRIPEVRRKSLLDRLDHAEADLEAGNGPDAATFHAWRTLRDRLNRPAVVVQAPPSYGKNIMGKIELPNVGDMDKLRKVRDKAADALRAAENLYRDEPTARRRTAFENRVRTFAQAQRDFLYSIAASGKLPDGNADLRSPQVWSKVSIQGVDRADAWRAVELIASDRDAAAVRTGRFNDVEAARRALQRAEARQALLDNEGDGVLDPVNKRFAASLARKRHLG